MKRYTEHKIEGVEEPTRVYWLTYKIADIEPVNIESFNSNNAWGFGGARGIRIYYPNGTCITIAKASYRHLPDSKFITVIDSDKRTIVDSTGRSFNQISQLPAVIAAITRKEQSHV